MMDRNPYAPPQHIDDDGERFQDEIDALAPNWKIRMAWGSVAATGFLAVLAGVQLLAAVRIYDPWLRLVPFAQIGFGIAAIVIGARLNRLRGWAALAGVVVAAALTLGSTIWFVFAAGHGMFSMMPLAVSTVGGAATVFCGLAISRCRRADEARRRLAESGLGASF